MFGRSVCVLRALDAVSFWDLDCIKWMQSYFGGWADQNFFQ